MKIIINSFEFQSILSKFKNLGYQKNLKEPQKSLYIITDGDTAIFEVCNGNFGMCYPIIQMEKIIPAKILESGTALIPNELLKAMESIESPAMTITDNKIIYGENSIDYVSPDYDFVKMDAVHACLEKLFEVPESELYKLIKNTAYSICKEELRPILTGLNFQSDKVAALDGYRLAICSTDKFNINESITLPGNLVKLLLKVLNKKSEKMVKIYTDDKTENIKVVIDDLIITSKQLNGEYINYKSIIPENNSLKIALDPKELFNKMKSMFKMTSTKAQGVVTFIIDKDKLTIEKVSTIGKIQESISIKVLKNETKLPLKIASNAAYWKEPLRKYNNCTIEFSSDVSPIVIKDDANLDLILPIKITEE